MKNQDSMIPHSANPLAIASSLKEQLKGKSRRRREGIAALAQK